MDLKREETVFVDVSERQGGERGEKFFFISPHRSCSPPTSTEKKKKLLLFQSSSFATESGV